MALGSMIAGGAQAVLGIGQMVGGLFMPKPDVPDYDIPQEVFENMTDAEYWSYQGLPEAQKQQFIENSARAGASALTASSSRKGGLGLVSNVAQQQQDSAKELLTADAQARMKNINRFSDARTVMAGEKTREQEWKMNKVMEERQRRDNMLGAGMQNLGQSFSTLGGSNLFGSNKKLPGVKSVSDAENANFASNQAEADKNFQGLGFGF